MGVTPAELDAAISALPDSIGFADLPPHGKAMFEAWNARNTPTLEEYAAAFHAADAGD